MKKLSILTVVLAFLATTSLSFAAQNAEINVTSEPVPAGSICSKAGGFTISFDDGTVFTEGDVLTFDLDLGTTLCKNIDLIIGQTGDAPASAAGNLGASVVGIPTLAGIYATGAITSSDPTSTTDSGRRN